MGHVGSAIASRLGYNKKWKLSWVTSGNRYKQYVQNDFLILRMVKNALNNYGNPDFSFELKRNNKEEDSNKKSGEEGIIKNPFVSRSLTHSHTRIARGLFITVSTYVMDSHLDTWRIKYTKNFRKTPALLFNPVVRNRKKPRLLLWFKKKRKKFKISRRKTRKIKKRQRITINVRNLRKKLKKYENKISLNKKLKPKKKNRNKYFSKKNKIRSFGLNNKNFTGVYFKKLLRRYFFVTTDVIKSSFKEKFKLKRHKYKYKIINERKIYDDTLATEPVLEETLTSRRLNQKFLNYTEKRLHVTKKIQIFSVLLFAVMYNTITSLPKRVFTFIKGCYKNVVLLYNKIKNKFLIATLINLVAFVIFFSATRTVKDSLILYNNNFETIIENTNNNVSFITKMSLFHNQKFKEHLEYNNNLPEYGKNKRFVKFYTRYKSNFHDFCNNTRGGFNKLSKKFSPKIAVSKIITYFKNSLYNLKKRGLKKKMKRYPLFLYQFLLKYRYSFLLPPASNKFTIFKAIILGFRWIMKNSKKLEFFFCTILRTLFLSLFLLPGFIPRFFMVKMICLLLIKEFSFRHLNAYFFRKIFNTRFLVFQTTYAALRNTIQTFDPFKRFSYNFFGMHTRNVTPSLVVNYICHKLGQYFQINQIIAPVIRHLKRLRSLRGFCIKIFGRLTRKERAAVIIRKFRRVTLAKKSADIEHASQSKALRFGMSGISAWFMLKDEGAKPMAYNFSMTITLRLVILQNNSKIKKNIRKTPLKIEKRFMHRGAKRFTEATNNILFRGQPVLHKREMTTWVGVSRKVAIKMPYPPTTFADDGLPNLSYRLLRRTPRFNGGSRFFKK